MSLFNTLFGVSSEAELLLNILQLGSYHIPRFRDCYYDNERHEIVVHTRTGGGNREEYEMENELLAAHPLYKSDEDDDFDSTYANFYFAVPDELKEELKEAFKDKETVTPAEKWQALFKKMDEMKNE